MQKTALDFLLILSHICIFMVCIIVPETEKRSHCCRSNH